MSSIASQPLTRRWGLGLLAAASLTILLTGAIRPVRSCAETDEVAPALGAKNAEESQPGRNQLPPTAPKPPATDSLGDPLPAGAKLRLGTLRFRPPSTVTDIALSPDEKHVVTFGDQLIVWDAATGRQQWQASGNEIGFSPHAAVYGVRSVAFSSDSSHFYTPGRPNEVVVWETTSGFHKLIEIQPAEPVQGPRTNRAVDATPDGRLFALGSPLSVVVFERDGRVLYRFENRARGPLEFNSDDRLKFGGHYSLVRFSPDGTVLAVVTSDAPDSIRLLDAKTGQELRRVTLKSRLVRLAFSPDGKQIAATERDSAVRLYDVESCEEVWSHVVELDNPYENYTSAIAFSPDGKIVAACATDYRIYLLDAASGTEIDRLAGHIGYPWALAFAADSKLLYSSGWDGAVRRWDVATRKELALPKGVRATGIVAGSPDGRTLAYGADAGVVHLVDANSGAETKTLEIPGTRCAHLKFSPDSRQLAGGGTSGDNVHVTVWDMETGNVVHRWDWPKGKDPHSTVESLSFTPNGNRLAAAVFRQSSAYVWDLATGQKIAQLPHAEIYALSFSPDGQMLATAGWDSIIRFWDPDRDEIRRQIDVKQSRANDGDLRMYTVCYAPQGGLIATAHLDGTVRVWHADDMTLQTEFQIKGRFVFGAMSFSPDGLWLATGSMGGSLALWDPLTGQSVWDVGRHQGYVYTVGFGRDAKTLLSGGADGVCYVWDLQPQGKPPEKDLARLWDDLAGDDAPAAYQAMWCMSKMPDRIVPLVEEKLRPVHRLIDVERLPAGTSAVELPRLKRLKKLLVDKDANVERLTTVRRALSLLAEIGTPEAIRVLEDLVARDPDGDLGHLSAAALGRFGSRAKP